MPSADLVVETPIVETGRVQQLRGLFDLPGSSHSRLEWHAELPLEERDWNIGLIVGPSGCGKSSLAQHLWPKEIASKQRWPKDKSLVDAFPSELGIKDITGLLSSVGFSSPPSWLRPFHCLSNGEQFRVQIARTLAEQPQLAVIDEFTSVVDRDVAQIASAAVAKTVRRRGQRLVAVTCHNDVEAWLTPDWVYRPATGEFTWGCLQRRPDIELDIRRADRHAWALFAPHHYLDAKISPASLCWVAYWRGQPAAFVGYLPLVGYRGRRRISRSVCLPDYQGVGIGMALNEQTAAMWKALGTRTSIVSTHPAVIGSMNRSPNWALTRKPSRVGPAGRTGRLKDTSWRRLTASFEYIGPALDTNEAQRMRD